MLRRAIFAASVVLCAALPVTAQVPPEERIPITDPDRLESLGFPRNARNVFVWSKADLKGGVTPPEELVAAPETWGSNPGYSTVLGAELQAYLDGWVELNRGDLIHGTYCFSDDLVLPSDVWAQIPVPDGSRLGSFRFWAYDSHDTMDLRFAIFETCQGGAAPPTNTLIGQTQTFAAVGDYAGFTALNALTVDNRDCAYAVRVRFADGGQDCVWELAVRKLQITWTRQVSPAPATASFQDVPTTHQFFRFIEALKDSGITGGCSASPPLFCPNDPITRGQMAVFLAAALGLSWP